MTSSPFSSPAEAEQWKVHFAEVIKQHHNPVREAELTDGTYQLGVGDPPAVGYGIVCACLANGPVVLLTVAVRTEVAQPYNITANGFFQESRTDTNPTWTNLTKAVSSDVEGEAALLRTLNVLVLARLDSMERAATRAIIQALAE